MANTISHEGIIDTIEIGVVRVRIIQHSACSSCKLSSHCTSSESKEKMIDVYTNDTTRFSIGEKVNVIASASVGAKAVILGFVIPLVIMMLSITIPILLFGLSEALAALIGLASLVPYYTLLYILRNRMQKVLVFQIEKLRG